MLHSCIVAEILIWDTWFFEIWHQKEKKNKKLILVFSSKEIIKGFFLKKKRVGKFFIKLYCSLLDAKQLHWGRNFTLSYLVLWNLISEGKEKYLIHGSWFSAVISSSSSDYVTQFVCSCVHPLFWKVDKVWSSKLFGGDFEVCSLMMDLWSLKHAIYIFEKKF